MSHTWNRTIHAYISSFKQRSESESNCIFQGDPTPRLWETCLDEWSPLKFWTLNICVCHFFMNQNLTQSYWGWQEEDGCGALRNRTSWSIRGGKRHMWLGGEAAWRPEEAREKRQDQGGGIDTQKSHCCDAFGKFLIPRTCSTTSSHDCIGQARDFRSYVAS